MNARTFAAPISDVTGRTLYRYVLSGHAGRIRTCERWMDGPACAEIDALAVAKEWGTAKRALKVRLVYPAPVMPGARRITKAHERRYGLSTPPGLFPSE